MKIVCCVNHSWPHVGGSEKVVQQIAESAANDFSHDVVVLSRSLEKSLSHNNVQYIPCAPNDEAFLSQLQKLKPDHTHVYSDCFAHWGSLLHGCEKISGTKSIALVGMNHMRESERTMMVFLRKKDQFKVITHSDIYLDYQKCHSKGVDISVIPNGVDLQEFDQNTLDFNTKGKKVVLCVSNFFPGKGQEHLVKALDLVSLNRNDFRAVFVYSSTNFMFGQILERQVKRLLDAAKFESDFIKNMPREKVVAAFKHASVFAFPSQKEVAPLVALESQAARTPWVALPVGNIRDLKGGIVIPHAGLDVRGYARYSNDVYHNMAMAINDLLDEKEYDNLVLNGRKQVEESYCWSQIGKLYNEVFTS